MLSPWEVIFTCSTSLSDVSKEYTTIRSCGSCQDTGLSMGLPYGELPCNAPIGDKKGSVVRNGLPRELYKSIWTLSELSVERKTLILYKARYNYAPSGAILGSSLVSHVTVEILCVYLASNGLCWEPGQAWPRRQQVPLVQGGSVFDSSSNLLQYKWTLQIRAAGIWWKSPVTFNAGPDPAIEWVQVKGPCRACSGDKEDKTLLTIIGLALS